jgi:hypothetical protein
MESLIIKISVAELPDVLSSMREWLDNHKANLTQFKSVTNDGIVTISVGFSDGDHNLDGFRNRFVPAMDQWG